MNFIRKSHYLISIMIRMQITVMPTGTTTLGGRFFIITVTSCHNYTPNHGYLYEWLP
ncbi:MAG: hypothetical protein IKE93_01185 [Erysipelotrichaceae bacterium]|nr:hypothetical protein [Erysipelotrichaceae bacterium]